MLHGQWQHLLVVLDMLKQALAHTVYPSITARWLLFIGSLELCQHGIELYLNFCEATVQSLSLHFCRI